MPSARAADDRGSVAAEFAVALPAVVVVLGLCLGGIAAGAHLLRLQDAAADAARSFSRGDTPGAVAARAARQAAGSSVTSWNDGELVCVHLEAPAPGPLGSAGVRLSAESCAAAGPR